MSQVYDSLLSESGRGSLLLNHVYHSLLFQSFFAVVQSSLFAFILEVQHVLLRLFQIPSIAKPKRPKHPNPAQTLFVRKSPHAKKWRDARGNTANLYAGGMQNIQEDTCY